MTSLWVVSPNHSYTWLTSHLPKHDQTIRIANLLQNQLRFFPQPQRTLGLYSFVASGKQKPRNDWQYDKVALRILRSQREFT